MTASPGSAEGREPKRVLIIVENLPSPFDRRVWQEATTLREAGYVVSIICPVGKGYEERYEELEGIAIHRHPLPLEADGALGYLLEYSVALAWEFRLAWRVHRGRGFDVIHACNPPDLIFLVGAFFKLLFGKKFLFDHHDINPELYEAKFGHRGPFWRLIVLLERLTFLTADRCIATNESYKAIAMRRGKVPADRVHVVRSGPSLERLREQPPRNELKRGRRYLVGYVGVMGAQEGLDQLLEAVRYIVQDRKRTDVHFGLVGGGSDLEALRRLSHELGIADYVTFTGRVPDAELLDYLSTADVCVNPDTYNEMNDKSTMNKIMEYMALGKPIVQYDLTEGRFSARGASLYAANNQPRDLADKLLQLLDDPDLTKRMGAFGRQRVVSELSWDHGASKLLEAYAKLWA